jgi:hypothetical protein
LLGYDAEADARTNADEHGEDVKTSRYSRGTAALPIGWPTKGRPGIRVVRKMGGFP